MPTYPPAARAFRSGREIPTTLSRARGGSPSPVAASPAAHAPPRPPTPIAVFVEFLRAGQRPPDLVITCAHAEALHLGNTDLASRIARQFAAVISAASPASPGTALVNRNPASDPGRQRAAPGTSSLATAPVADPPPGSVPPTPEGLSFRPSAAHPPAASGPEPACGGDDRQAQPRAPSPLVVAIPGDIASAGVTAEGWTELLSALAREAPDYQSERHVGAFRHRIDRLAEIGVPWEAVVGSIDAQVDAMTADLADAYRHLVRSGTIPDHVGREVALPANVAAEGDPHVVTLSGLLGICAVAGLEGLAGWLEHPQDRARFPHTTIAFLNCNALF